MDIVIMDLDGVLCDNSHRSHLVPPADQQHRKEAWRPFVAECVNDVPIAEGLVLYHALVESGTPVVIVTSRQEMFEPLANRWLEKTYFLQQLVNLSRQRRQLLTSKFQT